MREIWHQLMAALISFTRLPVSGHALQSGHFSHSPAWLPATGFIIGSLTALIYWLISRCLPADIAVFLALASSIVLTGALHEDGFADCCDGFGAGQDPATTLRIMKDPANGSFATIGLILLLGGKFLALSHLPQTLHISAFLLMHTLARWTPLLIIASTPHCSAGNSKMSAGLQLPRLALLLNSAVLLALLLLLLPLASTVIISTSLVLLVMLCRRFFIQRLHGYNGDCLGATEQLAEIVILLLLLLLL